MFHFSSVGSDYPIAFLAECSGGNYKKIDIWKDRTLGFGAKSNVSDKARKLIDKCIEEFSIIFFKVKGEL